MKWLKFLALGISKQHRCKRVLIYPLDKSRSFRSLNVEIKVCHLNYNR